MASFWPQAPFKAGSQLLAIVMVLSAGVHAPAENSHAAEAMHILKANCVSCHNPEKKKGGLVVTSKEALLKGGESGTALVAGEPDQSALIMSLAANADPHMPPKKQLSAHQIELLTKWAKDGAPWDATAFNQLPAPRAVTLSALPISYQPILAIALSPDAKRLAVGCGNELLVFEVSGKDPTLIGRASAHPDPVQSAAWSSDGKRIATGAFRRVVIWNAESLAEKQEITVGLTDRIMAVCFLANDEHLAIADGRVAEDGTVRLAKVSSGEITDSWSAHGDTIFDFALSNDGKLLATAGGDKLAKIWEVETKKEVARFEGHAAQVLTVAFSPDAGQLVTGSADQQLKLWDVKTKEKIMSLGRQTAAIDAVTWVTDGPAILAVTDSGALFRYTELKAASGAQSLESGQEKKLSDASSTLYCLAATADGNRIFAGSYDGFLFAWNKDGKLTAKINPQENKTTASATPPRQ